MILTDFRSTLASRAHQQRALPNRCRQLLAALPAKTSIAAAGERSPPSTRAMPIPTIGSPAYGKCLVLALCLLCAGQLTIAQAAGPKFARVGMPGNGAGALIERGKRAEHGVGAAQDIDRAIELYCEAAQLDDAEAHYHLGWIYLSGRTGKVDELLAASWFKAASARENPWAKAQLEKLGGAELQGLPGAECVQKADMVARLIPRRRPGTDTTPAKSTPAQPAMVVRSLEQKDIKALVTRLAPDFNLDPELVLAVIEVESNFNPRARSPKNAQGLMQLIPATATRFGVRNVWDPVENLRGGMAYLRWLLDHFDGDVELALAGYNAGENAVKRYGGIPPFAETKAYVKRIKRKLSS